MPMLASAYNNIRSSTVTIFMELFNTDLASIIKAGVYLYKRALTSNPIPQHFSYIWGTLVHKDLSILQTVSIFLSLIVRKIILEIIVLIIKSIGVLVFNRIILLLVNLIIVRCLASIHLILFSKSSKEIFWFTWLLS